jgi:YgiT-type zinc finger domain-containing protein
MICLICRNADILESFTTVKFERAEFRLAVTDVPARTCPSCGEAFVDEAVAEQLLRIARQTSDAATLASQSKYGTL